MDRELVSRREFLKLAGVAGATIGVSASLGGLVAACGSEESTTTTGATAGTITTAAQSTTIATEAASTTTVSAAAEQGRPVKIGWVSAATGPLAFFAMAEKWFLPHFQKAVEGGVVCADGKNHTFEVVSVDCQSDGARASQVAGDLIMNQKVDIISCGASPAVAIPVSAQAEANGCPCIPFMTVPEAHLATAGAQGLKWTYLFQWTSVSAVAIQEAAFALVPSNKKVAFAAPNDDDGLAWERFGPPYLEAKGYQVASRGLYQPMAEDFTAEISAFKKAGCELLLHAGAYPPIFVNLWKQCLQQGFNPKAATGGAAIMFPSSIGALGDVGLNLMVQGGWTPDLPFKDSLTGMTALELAEEFETTTGQQWDITITELMPFEWTVDVFKRSTNIDSKDETVKAIQSTNMTTMIGPLNMAEAVDPAKNMTIGHWHPNMVQPAGFAVQWQKGKGKWPFEQVIVASLQPDLVKPTGQMLPLEYK